jgi:hypothetical protein
MAGADGGNTPQGSTVQEKTGTTWHTGEDLDICQHFFFFTTIARRQLHTLHQQGSTLVEKTYLSALFLRHCGEGDTLFSILLEART